MDYLWLCLAAFGAGAVNAIAGGGTLLTFPTLDATRIGSIVANATSTIALLPGSVASAWGYRKELINCRRWLILLGVPSLVGGGTGACLLIFGGEPTFKAIVPWLILAAATLFLLQPTIARFFRQHAASGPHAPGTLAIVVFCQLLIGLYGGYFGAGIGILMLSTLSFLGLDDIHHVNALKSFLAFCMNGVSAVLLIILDKVHWPYGAAMAAAAMVGGYAGARLALTLRPAIVRWIVIALGFALAGYYLYKQWSS
jgi:hypothetical protein